MIEMNTNIRRKLIEEKDHKMTQVTVKNTVHCISQVHKSQGVSFSSCSLQAGTEPCGVAA